MINTHRFTWFGRIATACLAALSLTSCGGFFPSSDTIVSIAISPASAQVMPMATQQYSATATFGNNTTGDVTSQVTWISSATNVATISTSGLATAVALGTSNITAKSGSVTSTASPLTVSNKIITAITLNPQNATIISGQQQQFTATATYSDGSDGNITTSVSWSTSVLSVATITNTGLASGISTGTTTISASLGGVTGTTTLNVQ
ncbi:MAG: Ig-like domain-containing protein [Candidatus Korobacteraceae bacterium]